MPTYLMQFIGLVSCGKSKCFEVEVQWEFKSNIDIKFNLMLPVLFFCIHVIHFHSLKFLCNLTLFKPREYKACQHFIYNDIWSVVNCVRIWGDACFENGSLFTANQSHDVRSFLLFPLWFKVFLAYLLATPPTAMFLEFKKSNPLFSDCCSSKSMISKRIAVWKIQKISWFLSVCYQFC